VPHQEEGEKEAMIDRPSYSGPSYVVSYVVRLLVGVGAAGAVSLLVVLLIGPQQAAPWAQPDPGASPPSSQVYCGPWAIEGWFSERGSGWAYWNVRWCYSPEVS